MSQLTIHDSRISNNVPIFRFKEDIPGNDAGNRINFQFPPKILSDSRKGRWSEGERSGNSPAANFGTSGAREFTLQYTYIVTDTERNSNSWTIERIKKEINKIRGYFVAFRTESDSDRKRLVMLLKYPYLTGVEEQTCRIKAVDVKHGETLITQFLENQRIVFPLRTDISVDISMWNAGTEYDTSLGLSTPPAFNKLWY